jgi:hypothetical protein
MKVQVPALPFGKTTDVDDTSGVDIHPLEGRPVGDRRDDEPAGYRAPREARGLKHPATLSS